MPFIGSVPPPVRSIVHEHTRSWRVEDLYVLCSGNLTLERAVDERFALHSSDVSLYTSMLGAHFAGADIAVDVKEEHRGEWGWLTGYLGTPADRAATAMLGTSAFQGLHRDTAFHRRQRAAYRDQWAGLHDKTKEKLEALPLRLASYTPCDAAEFVHGVPGDAGVMSFPPFYKGGYEALYMGLDELLEWDAPSYEVMDGNGLDAMLDVMESRPFWLYGTDHRRPGREKQLRGIVEAKGAVPIYIYSSHGNARSVVPTTEVEPLKVPRLGDAEVTGPLAIGVLNPKQYAALRAQYLAPNILAGTPQIAFAVLDGGRLVGAFAFKREEHGRADAFLLSDFPVAPTRYRRLSKLIVYAALSEEARILTERSMNRRIRTVATTAFSEKPVSMKYRGLLDLITRDEDGGQGRRYRLVYRSGTGRWTLAEALAVWKERYGET